VSINLIKNKDIPTRVDLLAMAVEDALNEMGEPALEIVSNKLFQEYHCLIHDCPEHPDYLANVLKEIFGYANIAVIEKIKKNLGELASERPVEEFISVISK
jgi:hypothetical protein